MKSPKPKEHKQPSLMLAATPVVLTPLALGVQLFYFGDFTPHILMAIGLSVTGVVGISLGYSWKQLEKGIFRSDSAAA